MAGSPSDQLHAVLAQTNADPEFISLGYQDQYAARAQIASRILSQDPEFARLPIEGKQTVLQQIAMQPPALSDKNLEALVGATVGKAKQGDPASMKAVTDLSAMNAAGRSSVLYSLAAKAAGAIGGAVQGSPVLNMLFGPTPGAQMNTPADSRLTGGSPLAGKEGQIQAPLMVGDDASKLQVYFGALGEDQRFSGIPRAQKMGAVVGGLVDSLPFMLIPGGIAEGAAASGVRAMVTGSRIVANLGKLVIPAVAFTAAGAVGNVARQNALAAVQGAPELYTNTAAKIASVASEGAAANFLFSIGMKGAAEFGVPALGALMRKPVSLAEGLQTTGRLWWKKAVDPVEIDKAIAAAGGTSAVPEVNLKALHPYVRDSAWLRSFSMEAAGRDASTLDLRPLDQLAMASNDMPDTIFAPKDWSKPMDSGFNIWELKQVVKGGKKFEYLQSGEAANMGDLRSKLSDLAATRWNAIEDSVKPFSMQGSQALVRQGMMQGANAKAYDPFPETVKRGFTRPSLRGYLSPTEAQDATSAAAANGGNAYHVKVDISPEMVKRIEANKGFMVDGVPMRIAPSDPAEANALAIITNPAPPQAAAEAGGFAARALKENAGWTAEEARKFYLVQKGFDGVVDAPNGNYEVFFPSRMKWITDQVKAETGGLLPRATSERLAALGPLGSKMAIQTKIEAAIGKETLVANRDVLTRIAISKFRGTLPEEDVKNFVAQIADAKGLGAKVHVVRAAGTTDRLSADTVMSLSRAPDGRLSLTIPEKITSVEGQQKFLNDMLGKIDDLAKAEGKTPFEALRSPQLAQMVRTSPSRFALPFGDEAANRQWLSSIAYSEFGKSMVASLKDGRYALLDASGKIQGSYGSLQEMADSMLLSSLDDRFIRGDLYRQGYSLQGKKGGTYTLSGPGMKVPIKGNNLQELLKTIDYRPASISNRLAPQDIQISREGTFVQFDGKTMFATPRQIRQTMARFENPDELASMAKIDHTNAGDVYKVADGAFRVDIPSLKVTRYFEGAKEAQAFLQSDFKGMMSLKNVANSKGLTFHYDYTTGGFTIGDGKNVMQASSADVAHQVFASYPDLPGAREILTALDPQADEAVRQAIAQVDPRVMTKWKAGGFDRSLVRWDSSVMDGDVITPAQWQTPGVRHAIRDFSSTYDRFTEATLGREMKLDELSRLRNENKRSAIAALTQSTKDKDVIGAIFTGENGRPMPVERRQAIVAYKEAAGVPEALPRAKAAFGDLTPHEQMRLGQLQALTDQWFKRFGVDPSTYIKGYVSHVRDWALRHWDESSVMVSADELLGKAYNGMENVPKRLQAFFHNERAQTLLDATMEDDPLKIFNRYVDQGNKELFMKQSFQGTLDYLKRHAAELPRDVTTHVLTDMKTLGGFGEVAGMVKAQATLSAIHEAFSKVPIAGKLLKPTTPQTGAKMLSAMMSGTYLGAIGFRPWTAVRQLLQPYQMLAPRIGLAATLQAQKEILADINSGSTIMKRYLDQGILIRDVPVSRQIGEGMIAKATRRSMRMLWNADNVGRGTSARAAENMIDEGIAQWNRGVFKGDLQAFKNFTELRSIQAGSPQIADEAAKLAISGDPAKVEQAKSLFAAKLATETNPDYTINGQPHIYTQTLPGYVFGRFGTYATAVRENIYRGWQAGQGVAGKALFVGRYVGTSLAIYAALEKMGIDGKDFIPGYSGLFGGGPQASLAIEALQATGGTRDAGARQALEKMISPITVNERTGQVQPNLPTMLPGSLFAHYAGQMLGYMAKGDPWKAFLAATTTPTLK